MDQLDIFLSNYKDCIAIGVTEHWKTSEQINQYGLQNFYLATSFCRREENRHGGSAIFIRNGIVSTPKHEIAKKSIERVIECCACEVIINNLRVVIMCVYRPGDNFGLFISRLEVLLNKLISQDKTIIIVGDYNVDFSLNSREKSELCSLMSSYNLDQKIFDSTRITFIHKSCIDNIFTNCPNSTAEVIHSNISDHTAQRLRFYIDKVETSYFYKRIFSRQNRENFCEMLKTVNWNTVYEIGEQQVNDQWNEFMTRFKYCFEICFPLKKILKCTKSKDSKLKSQPDIIECKNRLDILNIIKTVDTRYTDLYNITKKEYNKKLVSGRSKMYAHRLKYSDNKSKTTWQIVNEINGKQYTNATINIPGEPGKIANDFNHFITNIPVQLRGQISDLPFSSIIKHNDKSMFVTPVCPDEIAGIVKKLKNKMSCGEDQVPTSIIKDAIDEIVEPLTYIINNSLEIGIFPDKLKTALVKPIPKKGDDSQMVNYRPISLLSSFSKIFEHVICTRLANFMDACSLLAESQHAYRKSKSTQTAIFQFMQGVLGAIERDELVLGLFLDLSRAYDCLDHEILLLKLELYGVRGPALDWIKSYLSHRPQIVSITKNNISVKSEIIYQKYGIPQGSVLGPILFVVYINDVVDLSGDASGLRIVNYADDTNISIHASGIAQLIHNTNHIYECAKTWFAKNKQILNSDKTTSMFFGTGRSLLNLPLQLNLNMETLVPVGCTKFLGMYIDSTLTWDKHVEHLCKRLNSVCYSLRVLSKYVELKPLLSVYFANFESLIRYGVVFYGDSRDIEKVFIIQKRALRVVLQLQIQESCRGKFKAHNLLTLSGIYIQECLLFLFKNKHLFRDNLPNREYNTRMIDYIYPKHRLTMSEKGTFYKCMKLFNKLPSAVKIIDELTAFKKQIHNILVKIEPYNVNEFLNYIFV